MVINAGKKDVIWNYLGIFISFGSKGRTIYLIQIIVIEKLLGPFYKQLVSQSGINWVNEYELIVKVVSTLVLSAILLGIVMGISRLCHKNQYVSKILFWKS